MLFLFSQPVDTASGCDDLYETPKAGRKIETVAVHRLPNLGHDLLLEILAVLGWYPEFLEGNYLDDPLSNLLNGGGLSSLEPPAPAFRRGRRNFVGGLSLVSLHLQNSRLSDSHQFYRGMGRFVTGPCLFDA